ncbi:hypothetical protein HETIRDRAFT_419601 [Heterobasidion irregulare TC 32-1]|uniref:Abscisic acid G-protein coupled receptor-like domain-containing protein n=1 Tax=Heterobasidion irregulare (strain TC 32-1) TaxID=747525 RepID=W4K2D4_HETIT|nr:uncharacterized protein HETIRDRAFT_419601 [Heterobasidion irregulare TC 32-1]ETW79983.1 hypothetical protein HETIRDRAFT_419601 [Heterobasidion irregulare TC 32-1]
MFSQLQWFRQQRAELAFERTFSGRLVVIGRRAMGLYCIFRGLTSILNILLPAAKPPAPDAPSRVYPGLLTALISLVLSDPSTAEAVLRQVNLAIVGIIIWSSVNRVLRGVASALKVTSRAAIKDVVLLVLAQVMGIYLLSTLIQLRTSFPPPAMSNPDVTEETVNLFTTLPAYEFFGPVFDWSFLLAAAGAGVGEWARGKMRTAE